jgi:signal transduction histidine kinase
MQMTHGNQQPGPLPPVSTNNRIGATRYTDPQQKRTIIAQLIMYLGSIPWIRLIKRIVRLGWQIVSFFIALGGSRRVSQQAVAGAQFSAIAQGSLAVPADSRLEKELQIHFLEMASHELKTPMTTIVGQTQLLLRRISRMPELSADMANMRISLESIDGQTRRLSGLVDELLDLYTIRAGKVQLHMTNFDMVGMCREVVEEQRALSGRLIEFTAHQLPVMLYADSNRLRQVVVNLISNAIAYSHQGSSIKVLLDRYRNIGSIEVQDRGPGISLDQQTHIFEPFYRGSYAQTNAKSGLGLGLAICKDIVERHHGRIWCRSRAGRGSTFIIELPLNKQQGVGTSAASL